MEKFARDEIFTFIKAEQARAAKNSRQIKNPQSEKVKYERNKRAGVKPAETDADQTDKSRKMERKPQEI